MNFKYHTNKTMSRFQILLYVGLLSFCLTLSSKTVNADTLQLPDNITQPENIDRPVRGLNMDDVEQQFGKPSSIQGPIGNPPITRWSYKQFTVVFEENIVIHSFVNP